MKLHKLSIRLQQIKWHKVATIQWEKQGERGRAKRERGGGAVRGTASRLVHYYCPWNCDIYYTCASAQATNRRTPSPTPCGPPPSSLTLLHICPAHFCPLVPRCAQMKRNRTNGLSAFWRVTPPRFSPSLPLRTRRPCPKCKLIACTN